MELKRQIRAIDLTLTAARKRQSPRTGFLHYFPADENATDTIPIFENFCFAYALFRHKTTDTVLEGKQLLEKLFAFQTVDGNFPLFLHDFPRCWDPLLPLKIAPILIHLDRLFGPIIGKEKIGAVLQKLLQFAKGRRPEKGYLPLWEQRLRACHGEELDRLNTDSFSPEEWAEWILTMQLAHPEITEFPVPYNRELQIAGTPLIQERGEPQPSWIEWILAEGNYSERLLRDHPRQIYLPLLLPFETSCKIDLPLHLSTTSDYRLFWKGKKIHSLLSKGVRVENNEVWFDLSEEATFGRDDLFEALFYCDLSSETDVNIEGRKGTAFALGDSIFIETPALRIEIVFELMEGEGDFCGHISCANRPGQIFNKGFEVYDWQIGLRTLRRSKLCKLRATLSLRWL